MALTTQQIADLQAKVVSSYTLSSGAGSTAFDNAGSNDGIIYGATWTTGKIGNALSFNGLNNYVDCGDKNEFSFTNIIKSEAYWIKTSNATAGKRNYILTKGNYPEYEWGDEISGYGIVYSSIYMPYGTTKYRRESSISVNDGNRHYIVVVYNNTYPDIYIDGVLRNGPSSSATTSNNISGAAPVYIGRRADGSDYFDGLIDEVIICNSALTQDEVTYLYNSGAGRQYPYLTTTKRGNGLLFAGNKTPKEATISTHPTLSTGLVSYYNMSAGAGTTLFDQHGSNDGTISGATWTTGKIGTGLMFDGNDNINIGDVINENEGSIGLWYKPSMIYNYNTIFDNSIGPNAWEMWIYYDGRLSARGNGSGQVISSTILSTNTWYYIVYTWKNGGNAELFINNYSMGTAPYTFGSASTTYLGGSINTKGRGILDEVGIWNKALTATEISDLYNSGSGLPYN